TAVQGTPSGRLDRPRDSPMRRHRLRTSTPAGSPARSARPSLFMAAAFESFRAVADVGEIAVAPATGCGEQHLHIADRALDEAAFAVVQVEGPHADEALRIAQRAHLIEAGQEAPAPMLQGERIARADVLEVEQLEVGAARDRGLHCSDR